MTRTKTIGYMAAAALVLGYGGMFATVALAAAGFLSRELAVFVAIGLGLVGEIGLWVAAATLGWTIFAKRKAILDRILGCRRGTVEPTG